MSIFILGVAGAVSLRVLKGVRQAVQLFMDSHALDPLGALRSGVSRIELAIRRLGNGLMSRYPALERPILRLWCRYMRMYGASQAWTTTYRGSHHASIDPYKVVSVDPDRIEYLVEQDGYPNQIRDESVFPPPKFKHAGRVVGGEWDALDRRYVETDVYRGFEARFKRNVPWQETDFYQQSVAFIEDGFELWGCTSERAFQQRCEFVESLYDSIAREGYQSQAELAAAPSDAVGDGPRGVETVTDEITVCVGRDGELLFMDGRNRLTIAKLLDLDRVPVWIMVRHAEWQRTRDGLAADPSRWQDLPDRLRTHPDLDGLRAEAADR